ncbi:MAG: c-type cytochrome biogenesis protein CcmI, partial [Gammaproteobacteria bacterium]
VDRCQSGGTLMAFVIGAGLLLLLVVAILAIAAARAPREQRRGNLRDQFEAELASDVAAGLLPAADLTAAAGDLDAEVQGQGAAASPRRTGPWPWVLIVLVVFAGVGLYWQHGNWRAAIHGDRAAVMHRAQGMLAQLQAHLEAHPDDEQGWITLAGAKEEIGDYPAAGTAYAHAVELDHEHDPDLLARWGEVQVLANPGHPTAKERAIFSAVLKSDPDNIRGLWYGGLLALEAGNRTLAVTRWRRLLGQNIPAPMAAFVKSRLTALGVPATAAKPGAAATAPRITVTVRVPDSLAARIKPGETLFFYARDPAGGPPLAAKRVAVTKFPLQVTLGNADATIADYDLATMLGKPVEVGAFVSANGKAEPAPGDPVASQRVTLHAGAQALMLTLVRPHSKLAGKS